MLRKTYFVPRRVANRNQKTVKEEIMTNFLGKLFLYLAVGAMLTMPLYGCEREGPAERAGERTGEAVDEAAEEAREAGEEAGEQLEEGAEETRERTR